MEIENVAKKNMEITNSVIEAMEFLLSNWENTQVSQDVLCDLCTGIMESVHVMKNITEPVEVELLGNQLNVLWDKLLTQISYLKDAVSVRKCLTKQQEIELCKILEQLVADVDRCFSPYLSLNI